MEGKTFLRYGSNGLAVNRDTKSPEIPQHRRNATNREGNPPRTPPGQNGRRNDLAMRSANIAVETTSPRAKVDAQPRDKSIEARAGTRTLRLLSRRGSVFVKRSKNSVDLLLRSSRTDADHVLPIQGRPTTPSSSTFAASPTTPTTAQSRQSRSFSVHDPEEISNLSPQSSTALEDDRSRPIQPAQKKDELRTAFGILEHDCQKFLSKPVAVRTSNVRSSLLPFLSKYGTDSINENLRPEDIEKRCMILKTWWAALLQTLRASPSENLSEVDRATVRDAVVGIMERPEWTSTRSANIRSNFAQMIYKQMNYVTNKMSQRKPPTNANLVSFCGKSCAYAFIYCPHAAELMISTWDIRLDCLKRLLKSSGIERPSKAGQEATAVPRSFPRHLQTLGFSSLQSSKNVLKSKPRVPPELDNVDWSDCHWIARWSGKETYLFCEFLQHFYTLLAELIPKNSTCREVLLAPGVVYVYSQTISLLDYMIRPQSNLPLSNPNDVFSPQYSDDVLKFDSAAPTLGAPTAIAQRQISESHIIRLARDLLSDQPVQNKQRAHLFLARGLWIAIKTTAQATSIYNHGACFALCEFFQEILKILSSFEAQIQIHPKEEVLVDWVFLIEVLRKMLSSANTMTEIRVYVLLFTIWPVISSTRGVKEKICQDLLLDVDHFHSRFNHWCPMVRGYYMRLLCWRVARFDGHKSATETLILETLLARVQNVWSQHKALWNRIQLDNVIPLSTTPCNPAPGRRLLIIRTDIPSIPNNTLPLSHVTTSNVVSAHTDVFLTPTSNGTFNPAQLAEKLSFSLNMNGDVGQKKQSLFRSIMGSRTPDNGSSSKSPVRNASIPSSSTPNDRFREPSTEISRKAVSMPPSPTGSGRPSFYEQRPVQNVPTSPTKPYRPATFRFSLELVDPRRAILQPMDLQPPRLPLAAHQHVQSQPDFHADIAAAATLPTDPAMLMPLKYSGRALAEWTLVVNESQNFLERRRAEGVPSNRLVETPVLTVESLRKPI